MLCQRCKLLNFEITIFIASPSDVALERNIVEEVCKQLEEKYKKSISIKPIRWENYPQSYHQDAQSNINNYLKPSECDIVIVIFWHRFGTYLPKNYVGPITKDTPITGTQWEFEEALASGKPVIHFYLKKANPKLLKNIELKEQYTLLQNFLKKIGVYHGNAQHGFHEFNDPKEFQQRLYNHLKIEIDRLIKHKKITFYWKITSIIFLTLLTITGFILLNKNNNIYSKNVIKNNPQIKTNEKNSSSNTIQKDFNNSFLSSKKLHKTQSNTAKMEHTVSQSNNKHSNKIKDKNNTTAVAKIKKNSNKTKYLKKQNKVSQKTIRKKLYTFLDNWLWAINNANLYAIESMYSKEFVLNGTLIKRNKFIKNLKIFFKSHRISSNHRMGLKRIKIKQLNTNIYKISFITYFKNFPKNKREETPIFLIIDISKEIFQIIEHGINIPKEVRNGQLRPYTLMHLEGINPKIYKNFKLHAIFRDSKTYHLGDEEINGWVPVGGNCFNISFKDDGKFGGYVLNFSSYGADALQIKLNKKPLGKPMHQEKIGYSSSNFWTNKWNISFDNYIKNKTNLVSICSAKTARYDYDDFMIKNITLYRWKP